MANITPQEIRTVIQESDDFGHEMRVGAYLSDVKGFKYLHGGTYTDPVTGKPRQYDFRAAFQEENRSTVLALECKNLGLDSPLVICGAERRFSEAYHDFIESTYINVTRNGLRLEEAESKTRRSSGDDSFYPAGKFVGKSTVRLKKDKSLTCIPDADVYDKWSQALSSSYELAEVACTSAQNQGSGDYYTVILPVVVVPDGSLWQATYDNRGDLILDPRQMDEVELYVARRIQLGISLEKRPKATHPFSFSHIHFLTLTGLKSFLSKLVINDHVKATLFNTKSLQYVE